MKGAVGRTRALGLAFITVAASLVGVRGVTATEGATISTIAGGDVGDGGMATKAVLDYPEATALDAGGNLYIADRVHNRIRRVSPTGVITTVAGAGSAGQSGDGGPATAAELHQPSGVSVAADGSLFIADTQNGRIRRVTPNGSISTFAKPTGLPLEANGGVLRVGPTNVLADGSGGVYFSAGHIVGHVSAAGEVRRVAGNGTAGPSGDGGPATLAQLGPRGLALTRDGSLLIADAGNHRVRRVDASGIITTVVGTGTKGVSGDGGPALAAQLDAPLSVAVAPDGSLVIADGSYRGRIRRVSRDPVSSVAAPGVDPPSHALGLGTIRTIYTEPWMSYTTGVSVAGDGSIYFAHYQHWVTKIDPSGSPSIVAGGGSFFAGDGGPAIAARLSVRMGVAFAPDGTLYVADTFNERVRRIAANGTIDTVAGTGRSGFSGDGGPATAAQLSMPLGLAVGPDGSVFIADAGNRRVRRLDPSGVITTVAGSGASLYDGDDKPAVMAGMTPYDVDVAADGALLIADTSNNRVRRLLPASGIITTFAGTGKPGYNFDNIPAAEAELNGPEGVAVAADGTVYIADTKSHRIRAVSTLGTITTIAGTGADGWSYTHHGRPAKNATLSNPNDVAVHPSGLVLFVEQQTSRLRSIDGVNLREIAGTVESGYSGDGGSPLNARLAAPSAVAVRADGTIAIADSRNRRVRVITGI